jgi:hypothetical protein
MALKGQSAQPTRQGAGNFPYFPEKAYARFAAPGKIRRQRRRECDSRPRSSAAINRRGGKGSTNVKMSRLWLVVLSLPVWGCTHTPPFNEPIAFEEPASGSMLLHRSPANGRYFENATGQIVYLQGSYHREEFQDNANGCSTCGVSSWRTAVAIVRASHGNFLRLSTADTSAIRPSGPVASPMPWVRSEICCAADGGSKFDLTKLDIGDLDTPDINAPHYFERMRARIADARRYGIYVAIMLFQSWSWENRLRCAQCTSWDFHPFSAGNNINGVDADRNADGQGLELGSLGNDWNEYQDEYIRRTVDSVADLDNVLFEVCNECYDTRETNAWQQAVMTVITDRERSTTFRHPVLMSALADMNNEPLFDGAADAVSPAGAWYETEPAATNHGKVSILDMDHINPCPGINDEDWPFKALVRGHNLSYMYCNGYGAPALSETAIMRRMGYATRYASRMDLKTAVPETSSEICSTIYCLIGPHHALAYVPDGGPITINLNSPDSWAVEWFDPATDRSHDGPFLNKGAGTVAAPFSGDAVLFLVRLAAFPPAP